MASRQPHTKFELGVSQYSGGLRTFLRQRLGSDADAEDALQEILLNLFRTAGDDLDSIANLPAWLYRSARNLLANMSRRPTEKSLDDCDFLYDILSDDRYSGDSQMLRSMFWQELDKALSEMPIEQRQVWELSELAGLSSKEIAQFTETSQATVLSRKYYAVKFLRKKLHRLYSDIVSTD